MILISKNGKWLKFLNNNGIVITGQLWIDRKNRKMVTIYSDNTREYYYLENLLN
jgi:hypothetical protein